MERVERPGRRAPGAGTPDGDTEFERHLGALLDAYAEEAGAPVDPLVAGGLARGRRLRARRRALWGAGTVACAGAVAAVVVFSGSTPHRAVLEAGGVTIPDFAPVAAASSGASAVTGQEAVDTLRGLLPHGGAGATGARAWDGPDERSRPSAGGRLLLEGSEVAVSVQGNFQLTGADALGKEAARKGAGGAEGRVDKSGTAAPDKSAAAREAKGDGKDGGKQIRPATRAELRTFYSCAARTAPDADLSGCTARNVSGGAVLITYEEHRGDLVERTADLLRKDGTRVVLTAANAADPKQGPATAAAPPLTTGQLSRMAGSKAWQPWEVNR
ncbi:hypothetical protein ABZY90_21775 [Streptomyces sp. NPDC006422]|uniref:hypothetical protein n=1 Tax=unclassified Streptomyces TaxID=2593676 RepID=UPI0033BA7F3F